MNIADDWKKKTEKGYIFETSKDPIRWRTPWRLFVQKQNFKLMEYCFSAAYVTFTFYCH